MAIKEGWKISILEEKKNKKVAIIGGGPSGITAAGYLARRGIDVTIYEKHSELGGLLMHGIPDFRLPKDTAQSVIQKVLDLGVKVELKKELGKDITLEELEKEYDGVLLTIGANISAKMGIDGEDTKGVYGGNELLEYKKFPDFKGKTAIVVGGGNTAIDAARTIKKQGAKKVTVVYRRGRAEMPAEKVEVEEGIEEGIEFLFQTNIVKINGKEKVESAECIKTELVEVEGKRPKPVNIEGSNFVIDTDFVIMALGSKPEENVMQNLGLELDDWGYIKVDENQKTSRNKVYAAGDISYAKSTVAWAARSGRDAAEKILLQLK